MSSTPTTLFLHEYQHTNMSDSLLCLVYYFLFCRGRCIPDSYVHLICTICCRSCLPGGRSVWHGSCAVVFLVGICILRLLGSYPTSHNGKYRTEINYIVIHPMWENVFAHAGRFQQWMLQFAIPGIIACHYVPKHKSRFYYVMIYVRCLYLGTECT